MGAAGAVVAKPKLGEIFPLRLSRAQRVTLDENAEAAGLTRSEFLRRAAGLPNWGRRDRSATVQQQSAGSGPSSTSSRGRSETEENSGAGALERRTAELAQTMPKVNAERLARRELAREKAKAALEASK